MFTGLVETLGQVVAATGVSPRRLSIASDLPSAEVQLGDSIAVDGCCLTVVERGSTLVFEAATETLQRTSLGTLAVGARVHLERAMRLSDRLGGHLVSGHIDGLGCLTGRQQRGSALYLTVSLPAPLLRLVAPQGSVTLAGVSLTVTAVMTGGFEVGLIPHTLQHTTLGALAVGQFVNVEADLLARYVARLLATGGGAGASVGAPHV